MKFNLDLNDIKYLKVIYKDNNDSTHCAKLAIKQVNNRDIFACAKSENWQPITLPQDVSLSIICENGLYRTTTTLKLIEIENPYVFFTLQTPEGLKYEQNREYFRVKMEKEVSIRFDNKLIPCKTYDISANGVKVIIDEKINIPEEVRLDIDFNPEKIITLAKLIRIENDTNKAYVSFNFFNLSENDTNLISKKCIQQQLQNKRNTLL